MFLTIHRGTHENGGSCLEFATAGQRLLLDFALPLLTREGRPLKLEKGEKLAYGDLVAKGLAPPFPYLQDERDEKPTAHLLSQAQLDRQGRSPWLPADLPLYAGRSAKRLLELGRSFDKTAFDPAGITVLEPRQSLRIGDFTVTPHAADHASGEAFAWLVEAEGKRIFYMGDLRTRGRNRALFDSLVAEPPADIDYLVLEGAALEDEVTPHPTEAAVEEALAAELEGEGLRAVAFSPLDLQRLLSLHAACRGVGRTLVIDPYTALVLDSLREFLPGLPEPGAKDGFLVFFVPDARTQKMAKDGRLARYEAAKLSLPEILAAPSRLVLKDCPEARKILRNSGLLDGAAFVRSSGGRSAAEDAFWAENGVPVSEIHSGGGASTADLIRLVEALDPRAVIPNQTHYPDDFVDAFEDRALPLDDGQVLEA
ncbi:MAG: hypothetical protein JNG85_00305 [Spirochaetaceae bacterium]|nr:hypothetical protein [Spirochaetaceae bacterium]